MFRSVFKTAQIAALVAGSAIAMNAMAADGQIRLTGEVLNKTCAVSINGGPSSILLNLDAIAATDMTATVTSGNGSHSASRNMRTLNITLDKCQMPANKTMVTVRFDSTGYGDAGTNTYRNSMLDSASTMDQAAKGVQIGFTKIGEGTLLMDSYGLDTQVDYKDATTQAQTYSFETRYVQTVADQTEVIAGDLETVATFSLDYK